MPRMNDETKLVFALEHVAHLEDLIDDNEWESFLIHPLTTLKFEFERQLKNERQRKQKLS
jgi:hypothetical protein|tara:strand:- start:1484 stop:1663 length:180 start_codon:yes stop_codon:yes gene_type:complete